MAKKIIFHEEARKKLQSGVESVTDAVQATIGPRGRNVVLDKGFGSPTITNDGVTIADEIELKDTFENMGAEIVKEVADKTNTEAGDGTTTSVVLAESIIEEGLKRTTMGANAMNIREGVEDAAQDAISEIEDESKQVRGDDIEHIASVAAESEELGEIIAETIDTVGKDGVVTVEESQFMGLESEVVEGLEFDSGYVSPHMVTDQDRMEAEYDDPAILVTDQTISQVDDILPLLEKLANSGTKELVIIADDVEGQALATFIVNKLRGGFNVLAVEAPGFGDRKKDQLEDIATVVGAEVISEDVGMQLDSVELSHLGSADRVIATKDSTTIVGGDGTKKAIEKRVERLKRQLENEDSSFTRDNIEERIAKLTGGVAVIRVGAATESEMEYLKLKIEDAVNATKAAIEEGVLPGGGTALVRIAETLRDNAGDLSGHPDYQTGYNILVRALDAPLKQIAENAGEEEGAAILHEIRAHKKKGYDAEAAEVVSDMMDAGIMDPAKVTKRAVENAASAAGILLTTEVAVADEETDDDDGGGGAPAGGGGMPAGGGMPGGMGGMM